MKRLYAVVFVLFLIFTIFLIALNIDLKNDNIDNDKVLSLIDNAAVHYKSDKEIVDTLKFDVIIDSLYNSFSDRIRTHKQIVLFVPQNLCEECFAKEYAKIMAMPSFFVKNIVVVTSFKKNRDVRLFIKKMNIIHSVYNYKDSLFLKEITKKGKIAFFVLDTTLMLQHLFLPIVFIPEQSNAYYEFLIKDVFGVEKNNKYGIKSEIECLKKKYNFGNVKCGDTVFCSFKIKNISKEYLIIRKVDSSCGCTIVDWENKPINPNDSTEIKVRFVSKKIGVFSKKIFMYANIENGIKQFLIYGTVRK